MHIVFPIIVAFSGSDIYYRRLCNHLPHTGCYGKIIPLSYAYEFVPLIHRLIIPKVKTYDVIHTNAEYGYLFRVSGKPLIITLHHNVLDPYYQKFTTIIQKIYHKKLLKYRLRRSLAACAVAVCVSKATQKSFSSMFPQYQEKLTVIYNGIDTDLFKPMPEKYPPQKHSLLFVGNLSLRKGADLLTPIMEKLGNSFELLCIGRIKSGIRLTANIHNIPFVPLSRLPEYYNRACLLLFPSRLEGFGYAVVEAMSCGRPVVCSNCSSLPELIDDGKGGFLCDPDNIDAFVEKIRYIAETPGVDKEMGTYNRHKVLRLFSAETMARSYGELYRKVLQ